MTEKREYGLFGVVFGALVCAVLLAAAVCLPQHVFAAELGSESPYVYCTYTDSDGNECDGNSLSAGTYSVSFVIQGTASASVLQVTAQYTDVATIDSTPTALLSDNISEFSSMGTVTDGTNLIFGFASTADNSTALDSEGTVLATYSVTFSADCDAADVITVSTDPNKTFVLTDYADGYDDEYALVTSSDGYSGTLYLMTCDITPAMESDTYEISGKVLIATDTTGSETTVGITGINVTAKDSNGNSVASATTADDGSYTLSLPKGEYTVLVSGDTTIDRTITLTVNDTTTVDDIGIVVCDYNKDGIVNTLDMTTLVEAMSDYDVYCDFNGDSTVNSLDVSLFMKLYNQNINYSDITVN